MQTLSDAAESPDRQYRLLGIAKAVETMQIGVTITDTAGRILFTNHADAAMHGYRVDELIGQDVRILAPGAKGKTMSCNELSGVSRWRRESTNSRKDGSLFSVQLMSDVVVDDSGTPIGIVTTCEDISDRKRAENALRESEERYALAVRGANDGLWDWDLVTNQVFFSPRWKEMLGYAEDEIEGTPEEWLSRINPDDILRPAALVARNREIGSGVRSAAGPLAGSLHPLPIGCVSFDPSRCTGNPEPNSSWLEEPPARCSRSVMRLQTRSLPRT